MPQITRTSIISGPAKVTFNSQTFWSKGDITLNVINDRFNIETATFGKVDERFSGRRVEVSFEPSGRFTTALAAVLWPYGATLVGASIFTGTDVPLTITSTDGRVITIPAAAITQMPGIMLGVSKTLVGNITFTGILADDTDPSDAGAFYTEGAGSYGTDTGFDVADILTTAYSAAWGSAPWDSFLTEEGWTIEFGLNLSEQRVDGLGLVDMTFASLDVTATAMPVGPTANHVLAKLSPEQALGSSVATDDDLVISSETVGAPKVTLTNAALLDGGLAFGSESKRIGELSWVATREVGSPLFEVAAVVADVVADVEDP